MSAESAKMGATRPSWLCTTDTELQRYLDLDAILNTARRRVVVVLLVPGLVVAARFGAATWIAALAMVVLAFLIECARRALPASPVFGIVSVSSFQLVLTSGVAASGGLRSPYLPWLAIPVTMLACRYRRTVTLTGIAAAVAAAVLACGIAGQAHTARDFPIWLYGLTSAALMLATSVITLTLQTAEIESRSAAARDALTGLPNRKALADKLKHLAAKARATDEWLCILVCDLDHFKRVNDTYGHQRGDAVLVETAQLLRSSLRDLGTVFRLGGEEFVAVLPGVDREAGSRVAERLRQAISATPVSQLPITVSVGVAAQRGSAIDTEALLASADVALYAAKNDGRDRVRAA